MTIRRLVLVLALCVPALFLLPACGKTVPNLPPIPTTIAQANADIHALSLEALGLLNGLGHVVLKAAQVEQTLEAPNSGIPTAVTTPIKNALGRITDTMRAANTAIVAGTLKDWPALKAKLDPIVTAINDIKGLVTNAQASIQGHSFWDIAQVIIGFIASLSGLGAFGG